ncbi:MAG: amino acid ABC transporter substrate-binding protein [Nitrospinae bacterium]|nr:amino acid ABC transporter substrate-binding protein [Nitrospinota bacterium]
MQRRRVWVSVWFCTFLLTTTALAQTTLETVKTRGKLVCGVNTGLAGFATIGPDGKWRGFDVDYCRALAAAILNDAEKVEFRPLTAQARFTALQSKEIDVLSRNTTWTLSRDTSLGLNFGVTLFYDGQGLMVPAKLRAKSAKDLDGATICVQSGTTTELNLADYFRRLKLKFKAVVFETVDQTYAAYDSGRCDAVTSDVSQLLAQKTTLKQPQEHVVLGDVMSKEPLGPMVRHGDDQWFDLAKWVAFGLIQAEEFGITSQNIGSFTDSKDPSVRRFLGAEGGLGTMLGLSDDFMARVIRTVGNYGELFDRHLKPLQLARGVNTLWTQGGLLYSPPFR